MRTRAMTTNSTSDAPIFSFVPPENEPNWSRLTASLTCAFNNLNSSIELINPHTQNLVSKLKDDLLEQVTIAKETATESMANAIANSTAISQLTRDMFDVKIMFSGLMEENKLLKTKCEQQENYSRRDNLIIRGLTESENESEDVCVASVKKLLSDVLKIDNVAKIKFVRCHRLGNKFQKRGKASRPVIVRFQQYEDRRLVWGKRFSLAGSSYSLCENFASAVEYRRNKLYPILSKARQSGKYEKNAYLNADTLRINKTNYTVDDLDDLPYELQPRTMACKSNNEHIVFGGIYSDYMFLSNYYKHKNGLKHGDRVYPTLEHAYQHEKALRYKDEKTALQILWCKEPNVAKELGKSVCGFSVDDWSTVKRDIMIRLLREKFLPGSDLAGLLVKTNGKKLAEAGSSKCFAIGLPLTHPQIFKPNSWTGENLLGECLMNVRSELLKK